MPLKEKNQNRVFIIVMIAAGIYFAAILFSVVWRIYSVESFLTFFGKEKSGIEILSSLIFLAAGIASIHDGIVRKRAALFIYGLFFIFIAGEDVQWGYSYLGYEMPGFFKSNLGPLGKMSMHNLRPPLNILFGYLPLVTGFCIFFIVQIIRLIKTRRPVQTLPLLFLVLIAFSAIVKTGQGNGFQAAFGYWGLVWALIASDVSKTFNS